MYNPQSAKNEKQIGWNKLKIDELINTMNVENYEQNQREISILKHKNKALESRKSEAMDWGVRAVDGIHI